MYKKARQKLAEWKVKRQFGKRQKHITKAVKHAKNWDGIVVSRAAYLHALEMCAVMASHIEKAGGISPNVRNAALSDVMSITQLFVDAAVLGDPNLQMAEVRDRYVKARGATQGKKARQRHAIIQALRFLGDKAPKLPQRNLSKAKELLVPAINAAVAEANKSVSARVVA